jgi:multidrug efflux pump
MSSSAERSEKSFVDFFIQHPVFSWVLNIIIVLLGFTAFFQLSIRQYPKIENIHVYVEANFAASVRIMENQVAKPLEDALVSIENLTNIQTEIQANQVEIALEFANRTLDSADSDVKDAVGKLKEILPQHCKVIVSKAGRSAESVMNLVMTSDVLTIPELFTWAEKSLKSNLESIAGVATVSVGGGSDPSMELVLDPLKLASYRIAPYQVVEAVRSQNFEQSPGLLRNAEKDFSLTTQAALSTEKDFNSIIVSKDKSQVVRLEDIGRANIKTKEEKQKILFNGKPAILISVTASSIGNPVEISKAVREKVDRFRPTLPKGTNLDILIDRAKFIEGSIQQVYSAIFEAILLVLAVVLLFLRSFRASLIPLITIPISLMGTFFLMYLFGFSINVLSLLSIVLAIGLVVDDAIVVLENVYRYIEQGIKPLRAAILGTREIRFSVIAMTLTLAAVYAPIAMAPGKVGKLFREFALTLAGAVIISGIVALTLSPLMCAALLKSGHGHGTDGAPPALPSLQSGFMQKINSWLPERMNLSRLGAFFQSISLKLEKGLNRLDFEYGKSLVYILKNRFFVALFAILISFFSLLLFSYQLKKEIAPQADEGLVITQILTRPSMNLKYIAKKGTKIDQVIRSTEGLEGTLLKLSSVEASYAYSPLKNFKERKPCPDIAKAIKEKLVKGVVGLSQVQVDCSSSSPIQEGDIDELKIQILTDRSDQELKNTAELLYGVLRTVPGVQVAYTRPSNSRPGFDIELNRARISQLGIDPYEVSNTLNILVGNVEIGNFQHDDKVYPVHIWINEQYRKSPEDLDFLFVKGRSERKEIMVPLKKVISLKAHNSQSSISHIMKKRVFSLYAQLKPGYSLPEVYERFKNMIKLPPGYEVQPGGKLATYFKEGKGIYFIFALAILFIFLVMAAQFESFISPFIILTTVPLALGGAIITLVLFGGTLNVFSQIGLITLIGLITKHGILIVDFANQKQEEGLEKYTAIIEACKMRLRPILMTTAAMVLGAVPLALATGPGAEGRQQIGLTIVGGMTLGTLFTLFVIPVVYYWMSRVRQKPVA